MAAIVAEDLVEIGGDELDDDDEHRRDAPPPTTARRSATPTSSRISARSAADLLAMCAHEGTLPVDLLVAVCEKAGCGEVFEDLRG